MSPMSTFRPQNNKKNKNTKHIIKNNKKHHKHVKKELEIVKVHVPRRRHNNKHRGGGGSVGKYIQCLESPFSKPALKLGFGNFGPSTVRSAFNRFTYSNSATATDALIVSTPNFTLGGGTLSNVGFLTAVQSATPATSWTGASVTINRVGATNATMLNSVIQSARLISMGMRVTVRYAATSVRGQLLAAFLPDETASNLFATSSNGLQGLACFKPAYSNAAGEISVEVQYRPIDASSFAFSGATLTTATAGLSFAIPQLVVVLAGWPAAAGSYTVEINTIAHYETLCGLDGAGDDEDGGDSLSASGLTIDQAGAAAEKAGAPIITSELAIAAIDSFISTLRSSGLRGGRMMKSALGEQNSLPITYGDSASSTGSVPVVLASSALCELRDMRKAIAELQQQVRSSCDSDFEEEYGTSAHPPKCPNGPSSPGIDQLSRSTVQLIGELARKTRQQ
jgi:hypothetical protein